MRVGRASGKRAVSCRGRLKRSVTARVSRLFVSWQRVGQPHRRDQFAALGAAPARVVFLGDSITEFGLWDEWLPDGGVLNRGVGWETTAQLITRLDTAIDAPAAVFLLIGTNDLTLAVPEDEIVGNLEMVLRGIQDRAPGTHVTVQSVMPRTPDFHDEIVALICRYERLAHPAPHVDYLDLWPFLADEAGGLKKEYSLDFLHLNGAGYQVWADVLRPRVKASGSSRATRSQSRPAPKAHHHA